MNMRSDLTAAARIRDAAIDIFGRRGFEAASVREIAEQAGVSPALVIHHYGSKEKLRQHCDDFVIDEGMRLDSGLDLDDDVAMADLIRQYPPHHPWLVYVSRNILDGGPAGVALWDRLVAEVIGATKSRNLPIGLRAGVDQQAAAALLTAVGMAPLAFQTHLARSLGADQLDGEAYQRIMATLMELLMNGLYEVSTEGEPA